ncbi:MAG: NAD(P)-binding protein [Leptospirales bacterium]|nr:NAD(P)-binding protein [Leptospirales bacterium]
MRTTNRLSRRSFLGALTALGLAGCETTSFVDDTAASRGHRLRTKNFPAPTSTLEIPIAIVGGGVSGLSAGWWLSRTGYSDYLLLELGKSIGGNSGSGKNDISEFPWGAHYVPLPPGSARFVLSLFEEIGVIKGYDPSGLPLYSEWALVHDPAERLMFRGAWQDGVIPEKRLEASERLQFRRFLAMMHKMKLAVGRDGRKAFGLPIEDSSKDPQFTGLDRLSMEEFMRHHNFTASPLTWYVNYCCRDDYGTPLSQTSAWAGVHYFAARTGVAANAESDAVLTWPAGNGFLTNELRSRCRGQVKENHVVFEINQSPDRVSLLVYDFSKDVSILIHAKQVIYAAPRFTATRVINDLPPIDGAKSITYAPWLVANISLAKKPAGNGAALSWENVRYGSQSLGYVVATHQSPHLFAKETVITYYLPLDEGEPSQARKMAAARSDSEWKEFIINDLSAMHPDIARDILGMEIRLFGHGMIRPTPGFIWGETRRAMLKPHGRITFANSDMSGISIFEEAQYRGVKAAMSVRALL